MRRERRPDDLYQETLRLQAEPEQPFEAALWRFARTGVGDDAIVRVVDAYEDDFERELLQAWIIAGASDLEMNERIGVAIGMLPPYRHLCCNLLAFRDRLEMMRWVHLYKGSYKGKLLLQQAVHLDGIEAVAHMCGLASKLDPGHVAEQTMRTAYFRGTATLRASNISSAEAAAAHQLLKTGLASAAISQKRGAPDMSEVFAKLRYREETFGVDSIVPRAEIMGAN